MKIARVESFVVSQSLESPFAFSQWEYASRSVALVRITAEDGLYGWGEGYGPASVVKAGIDLLAGLVVGRDALETATIWQSLYLRTLDYARSGTLAASVSAIDVALWDLKGKLLGQPVHVLLGGRRRTRVKVYATGMYFTAGGDLAEKLAAEARGYVAQGFPAVKMKVGHSPAQDARNVAAVRAAIGPGPDLMIDANHGYGRREARELCARVEEHRIAWFEEPLSPEDYEGYRELRGRTSIPLAAGECEYWVHGCKRLLDQPCVDLIQPDICAAGGLTEMQRIVALARAHHVDLTPHCWGTGIAFAAALHLTATLDVLPGRLLAAEPVLEMDRTENPLRDRLTRPCFQAQDGTVEVPSRPGLGIDVDPRLLETFLVRPRARRTPRRP
jgi:D-galactarolactone cycloisomerase